MSSDSEVMEEVEYLEDSGSNYSNEDGYLDETSGQSSEEDDPSPKRAKLEGGKETETFDKDRQKHLGNLKKRKAQLNEQIQANSRYQAKQKEKLEQLKEKLTALAAHQWPEFDDTTFKFDCSCFND